jgi:UDP-glucose 4-epimerase
MKVLFTGASSLAAKETWPRLMRNGIEVTTAGRTEVPSSRHIACDLTKSSDPLPDEYFDAVVHFASVVPINEGGSDWAQVTAPNLCLTINLLRWARGRVGRVVLASSCAVYGEALQYPVTEEHAIRPATYYALSKYAQEQLMAAFCAAESLPLTILRLGYVYGSGMPSARLVVRLLDQIVAGEPIALRNATTAGLHLIHTADIGNITGSILSGGVAGVFNAVMPYRITLADYVSAAMGVIGKSADVSNVDDAGVQPTNWYSASRLAGIGIRAEVSLRDGITSLLRGRE